MENAKTLVQERIDVRRLAELSEFPAFEKNATKRRVGEQARNAVDALAHLRDAHAGFLARATGQSGGGNRKYVAANSLYRNGKPSRHRGLTTSRSTGRRSVSTATPLPNPRGAASPVNSALGCTKVFSLVAAFANFLAALCSSVLFFVLSSVGLRRLLQSVCWLAVRAPVLEITSLVLARWLSLYSQ